MLAGQARNDIIQKFVTPPRGLEKHEAPNIVKDSSSLAVLMLLLQAFFCCGWNRLNYAIDST
jgi:diacylglycerol kinase